MAGVAEVYLPAFGLAIGLSPVIAGLIASAPLLAGGLLQLLAPRAIARASSLRGWVAGCMVVQALAFAPLLVLALVGAASAPIIMTSAAVYWVAGMGASAAWNPWMARVVPARLRGRFFGRRQGLVQGTMLLGLIGAGWALQVTPRGQVLDVYAVLFALAMIARLISALMVAKQGKGVDAGPRRRMRFRSIPPRIRGTPRVSLLAYLVAMIAGASISGPFLTPYLLQHEQLSYGLYSIVTAAVVIAKSLALPVWGRVLNRTSVRRVLTISALAITPIPMMWIASDAVAWLLIVQVYAGIAWAGFDLGLLMALFDGEDDAERTTMQAAFSALQAVGTAGASFVGGAVLGAIGADHTGYAAVFLVSAVARFLACVLLVRQLPVALAKLPFTVVTRAWTLAVRPWGGTLVRPFVEGLERLRVDRKDRE